MPVKGSWELRCTGQFGHSPQCPTVSACTSKRAREKKKLMKKRAIEAATAATAIALIVRRRPSLRICFVSSMCHSSLVTRGGGLGGGALSRSLCGAISVTGHHRGAINVHVRRRDVTFRTERHHGAAETALRRRGASSVAERHRDAGNVHVHRRGVTFRAERRCGVAQTIMRRRGAS